MEDGAPPPPPPDAASIKVPIGPDPPPDPRPLYPPPPNPEKKKEGEGELSAEDAELKERLELAVERLKDPQLEVQRLALELLRKEIRESTRCACRPFRAPPSFFSLSSSLFFSFSARPMLFKRRPSPAAP